MPTQLNDSWPCFDTNPKYDKENELQFWFCSGKWKVKWRLRLRGSTYVECTCRFKVALILPVSQHRVKSIQYPKATSSQANSAHYDVLHPINIMPPQRNEQRCWDWPCRRNKANEDYGVNYGRGDNLIVTSTVSQIHQTCLQQ